jgi:GNAT superfamily N-acetyltransferase
MVDETRAKADSSWELRPGVDDGLEDLLTEHLVDHNKTASPVVRERFEPDNLRPDPVAAYVVGQDGQLLAGCTGSVERVWHWLTVDLMWVAPGARGRGLGRSVLASVEEQARRLGCRWAKLNTFDFQAPAFYSGCGYEEYGREVDYPPGHVNHLMRKDL